MKTKLFITLTVVLAASAYAGSATWSAHPTMGNWNLATNWIPATIPNGPTDTATFDVSTGTSVAVLAPTEVAEIAFTPTASQYSIVAKHTAATTNILTLSGASVTNSSGFTQTLATDAFHDRWSEINFTHTATAGSDVLYNVAGNDSGSPSIIRFFDTTTAGDATIVHLGPDGINAQYGRTEFNDNSTAGASTIMNNSNGLQGASSTLEGTRPRARPRSSIMEAAFCSTIRLRLAMPSLRRMETLPESGLTFSRPRMRVTPPFSRRPMTLRQPAACLPSTALPAPRMGILSCKAAHSPVSRDVEFSFPTEHRRNC